MKVEIFLFACAGCLWAESPPQIPAPFYTPSSIVNAANFKAGPLAPNTIATLFGSNLAFASRAVSNEDIYNGTLPTTLPGTGVHLLIDGNSAFLYYVSPTQINFLVPSTLTPGASKIQLTLDGRAAESVRLDLVAASPALFLFDPETVSATYASGSAVSASEPAKPDDIVILYATGLGATRPTQAPGQIPTGIAWIDRPADFKVTLDDQLVDRSNVQYVGIAPGCAGLYQINLKLPGTSGRNPELRIGFKDVMSPAGVRLPVEPRNP